MKLIVHIGAHKTATTHIQQRLQGAQLSLRERRTIYLGPRDLRARVQFSNLLKAPGEWPLNERAWRARIEAEEEGGAELFIISEENILGTMKPGVLVSADGRLYPEAVERLSAMIDILGRKPDVLALGIREPASFMNSAYGNWIMSGDGLIFEEFIGELNPSAMRWSELVGRLISGTGVATLMAWRQEDFDRFGGRVMERLVGKHRAHLLKPRPRDNPGFSRAAYDMLIAGVLAAKDGADTGKLARQAREAFPLGDGVEALQMIAPDLRAESRAAYDADWEVIKAMAGVSPVLNAA